MLNVSHLSCQRDGRTLFAELSFAVGPGEVLQILGDNGSGKTTLLKIIMGIYTDFDGKVVWETSQAPSWLGHRLGIKDALTVVENLRWLGCLHRLSVTDSRLAEALAATGLTGYADRPCDTLSEGQRKLVSLTRFFLQEEHALPACWVLDEPFNTIDATGISRFEARLSAHIEAGGLAILSSHRALSLRVPVQQLLLSNGVVA